MVLSVMTLPLCQLCHLLVKTGKSCWNCRRTRVSVACQKLRESEIRSSQILGMVEYFGSWNGTLSLSVVRCPLSVVLCHSVPASPQPSLMFAHGVFSCLLFILSTRSSFS